MANIKWDEFPDGNNPQTGDQIVGLRSNANYRFDFPSSLVDIGNLSPTTNNIIYGNGTNFVEKALNTNRIVYVDANGSDTTGDGSILFPVATIFKANSLITGNNTTNRWIVSMGAGRFNETNPIVLKPYVSYVGRGNSATYITSSNNLITLDSAFGSTTARVYISSIYIGGTTAINFDLDALGGSFSFVAELVDVSMNAGVTINGRSFGADFLQWYGGLALGNIQISNAFGYVQDLIIGGDVTIDTANNSANTAYDMLGCGCNGSLSIASTGGATNTTGIHDCSFGTTVSISGADTTVNIDASSLPKLSSNYSTSGSPTVNLVTSDYGITADYTPVNYTPTASTVSGNFEGIDAALAAILTRLDALELI